ncbi:hypothetical protein Tco_0259697 [Tanacetum coccineum]
MRRPSIYRRSRSLLELGIGTGNSKVNTASAETSTASFSDATAYAFLSSQPQGSQLVHEDLEQIHDDDLEEMDLKWNNGFVEHVGKGSIYLRSWKEIIHSMEIVLQIEKPRASEKAICAIIVVVLIGVSMAEDEIQAKWMALIRLFLLSRGLSILEAQVVKYKESEILFSEEIALLKRSVGHKDYLMGLVKTELEKVKEEKEGVEFKLAKFEKSSKDLDDLLASQVTDKSKKGFGYNAVPSPHPLILNRPTPLDLSYSGLEEFQQPEINWYGPRDSSSKSTNVCNRESNNSKENIDDSLTQQPKSVIESSTAVPTLKVDTKWKEKFFNHTNNVRLEEPKKASENTDAPIIEDWVSDDEEKLAEYAELYRSQRPRGNQRGWNGQKTDQLGCNFVFKNKACFICGDFDHIQYNCPNAYKHMVPRAVLMKTGLKTVKNNKTRSTVRSVNTARPVSTVRCVNTVRSHNTAHSKPTVSCARPKTHFQNQAQRALPIEMKKDLWIVMRKAHDQETLAQPLRFQKNLMRICYFWVECKWEEESLDFNNPFGCHVTILNTLDNWARFDGKVMKYSFGLSLTSKAFRVYNIELRTSTKKSCMLVLENKPMRGGQCPKWLLDLVCMQEGTESNISSQKDQDCIFMPIWKDASYFEDITPQSVDDVLLQGQDGNHDDSSFQDDGIDDHQVNTASPQVNTASPQVNTGSRELSTADNEVSTATSEGLMGPKSYLRRLTRE